MNEFVTVLDLIIALWRAMCLLRATECFLVPCWYHLTVKLVLVPPLLQTFNSFSLDDHLSGRRGSFSVLNYKTVEKRRKKGEYRFVVRLRRRLSPFFPPLLLVTRVGWQQLVLVLAPFMIVKNARVFLLNCATTHLAILHRAKLTLCLLVYRWHKI